MSVVIGPLLVIVHLPSSGRPSSPVSHSVEMVQGCSPLMLARMTAGHLGTIGCSGGQGSAMHRKFLLIDAL